jgi:hypothetical protein
MLAPIWVKSPLDLLEAPGCDVGVPPDLLGAVAFANLADEMEKSWILASM